jgi:hypothetical protein
MTINQFPLFRLQRTESGDRGDQIEHQTSGPFLIGKIEVKSVKIAANICVGQIVGDDPERLYLVQTTRQRDLRIVPGLDPAKAGRHEPIFRLLGIPVDPNCMRFSIDIQDEAKPRWCLRVGVLLDRNTQILDPDSGGLPLGDELTTHLDHVDENV